MLNTKWPGTDTSWTPVRKYVYDGVNMVADSGQLDSNWNQYAFLGYKRLAWVSQDSGVRVRYIGSHHLGTANLLMDSAGGILSRYVLDPWGNVEYAKETVPLRYLYTGKESDAEAGGMVTYINARYLENERGMWLGRDPAEEFYTPYGYGGMGRMRRLILMVNKLHHLALISRVHFRLALGAISV